MKYPFQDVLFIHICANFNLLLNIRHYFKKTLVVFIFFSSFQYNMHGFKFWIIIHNFCLILLSRIFVWEFRCIKIEYPKKSRQLGILFRLSKLKILILVGNKLLVTYYQLTNSLKSYFCSMKFSVKYLALKYDTKKCILS